jgi:hypothetical protein
MPSHPERRFIGASWEKGSRPTHRNFQPSRMASAFLRPSIHAQYSNRSWCWQLPYNGHHFVRTPPFPPRCIFGHESTEPLPMCSVRVRNDSPRITHHLLLLSCFNIFLSLLPINVLDEGDGRGIQNQKQRVCALRKTMNALPGRPNSSRSRLIHTPQKGDRNPRDDSS